MSSSHFEATTSADGDEQVHQARAHGGGMYALSNQVNMTNCYKRCEYFFRNYHWIHFKVLIVCSLCWIMAGYLGDRFRSVEEAYERGLDRLFDLVYKDKVLRLSKKNKNMVMFAGSSTKNKANCRHPGFCLEEDVFEVVAEFGFYEAMSQVNKVVLSKDEMLSMSREASIIGWSHSVGRYKYLAAFNPSHYSSLKVLLENVKSPCILLLRGFEELTLALDSFPLHRISPEHLTFFEISGSSRLTTIPDNTISQFKSLCYLNLSDLPIEEFPSKFFWSFMKLHCLILRGCYKLLSLDLGRGAISCRVLDLSHCTALQNFVYPDYAPWLSRFLVLDLSYTPFDHFKLISTQRHLSHLYLGGSKLEDFSFPLQSQSIKILDLSGCSCLTKLNEGLVTNLSNLQKLDFSWTKVKQLPSCYKTVMLNRIG